MELKAGRGRGSTDAPDDHTSDIAPLARHLTSGKAVIVDQGLVAITREPEELCNLCTALAVLIGRLPWLLGDAMIALRKVSREAFEQWRLSINLSKSRLDNIASTCRAFPHGTRRLHHPWSFKHHELLAALDEEARARWAERVELYNMSATELSVQMRLEAFRAILSSSQSPLQSSASRGRHLERQIPASEWQAEDLDGRFGTVVLSDDGKLWLIIGADAYELPSRDG